MKRIIGIAIISSIFTGCFQQIAVKSLSNVMDNGFEVLNEEQDLTIAESSISSDLKLLEALLKSDPENEHCLLLASIGYSSYSLGFAEDESVERAQLFYLRGKDFGMKVLNQNPKFAAIQNKGLDEFRTAVRSFSKEYIPAIFWTAVGWGSYISLNLTDPSVIVDLPKVEEMMKFVIEKEPTYFYGGAYFFLGTLYGSRPKMLGGDPELSKTYFEECLKINNSKFLLAFVYYARSYAVQTQNRELFEECLNKVDSTSVNVLPQARLSNAIAKKKAKLLHGKIGDLF